jgi:hypothetical protein
MAEATKNKREVLGVWVTYRDVRTNLLGEKIIVPETGYRGEEVELFEEDEKRLDSLGQLVPKDTGLSAHEIAEQRLEATLARALNPVDVVPPPEPINIAVSPPSLGATPLGAEGDVIEVGGEPGGKTTMSEGSSVAAREALRDGDSEKLAEIIRSERPNAGDTVALAGGDPDKAAVVLEAENAAHDGDGRATVVGPLEKIAGE